MIWNGDMIFAQVDNGQIETWAKVKTQSGAEGWSRLNYLCPVEYEGKRYYVKEKE